MEASSVEDLILERYREKCLTIGGPKAGYVLRRQAIVYRHEDIPEGDFDSAFGSLVDQGLLAPNDDGAFYFLTEAGVERLEPGTGAEATETVEELG